MHLIENVGKKIFFLPLSRTSQRRYIITTLLLGMCLIERGAPYNMKEKASIVVAGNVSYLRGELNVYITQKESSLKMANYFCCCPGVLLNKNTKVIQLGFNLI